MMNSGPVEHQRIARITARDQRYARRQRGKKVPLSELDGRFVRRHRGPVRRYQKLARLLQQRWRTGLLHQGTIQQVRSSLGGRNGCFVNSQRWIVGHASLLHSCEERRGNYVAEGAVLDTIHTGVQGISDIGRFPCVAHDGQSSLPRRPRDRP